ncbi:hypothetical protein TNCV_1913121 [Trichonephila clavipes]|nr:hypothetical protein TNCV_1913121 [Trichonephila clavipes]
MPRTKLSHLARRGNISKRWSTSKNDNSKNQPLADITTRIQNKNVLKMNTTAKVLNGHLVGSNQLLPDVRKNVREAYGSKNDKDIVDIGVSYEMEAG